MDSEACIVASYAAVDVQEAHTGGGFVGLNEGAITACYATGSVRAGQYAGAAVGGFVGTNTGAITASYAIGDNITSTPNAVDLFLGSNSGTITTSYYNSDASFGRPIISNPVAIGQTADQLRAPTTYGATESDLYYQWNRDLNGALTDNPAAVVWDFGQSFHYPALRLDANGDGTATAYEFGGQDRLDPLNPAVVFSVPSSTFTDAPIDVLVYAGVGFSEDTDITLTVTPPAATFQSGDCVLSIKEGSAGTLTPLGGFTYTLRIPSGEPFVTLSFSSSFRLNEADTALTLTLSSTDPSLVGTDHVHTITLPGRDHGDTFETATRITATAPGEGPVATGALAVDDVDYFTFAVEDDEPVLLRMYTRGPYPVDTVGSLYDDSHQQLAFNDDDFGHGDRLNFYLFCVLRGGDGGTTFFARVDSWNGRPYPFYALHVEIAPLPRVEGYDTNANGLIEVSTLAQLDAIRHDLDGDGLADDNRNFLAYSTAFPDPVDGAASDPFALACTGGCRGYELMGDLDFEDANGDGTADDKSRWAAGATAAGISEAVLAGWPPIGTPESPYTSIFEGNRHIIRNLCINANGAHLGLFGQLQNAEVRNLGLENVDILLDAEEKVGALTGEALSTLISGCYATGRVPGADYIGGLVGIVDAHSHISKSYAAVHVHDYGSMGRTGGLVGDNAGTITACYATGGVEGDARVGGLVGNNSGDIHASYATGSVRARLGSVGGLVGQNDGEITASYATGAVHGGTTEAGGLVGLTDEASVINSYYNSDAPLVSLGGEALHTVFGRTATQLRAPTTYGATESDLYYQWNRDIDGALTDDPDAVVWDFGEAFHYPVLRVDFDGDSTASVHEFGDQGRPDPLNPDPAFVFFGPNEPGE